MSTEAMSGKARANRRRPLLALALLTLAAILVPPPAALAEPVRPVGPSLPVGNPATDSSLAVVADGGYVVVGRTAEGGGSGSVWLQRVGADDRLVDPPRHVGTDRDSRFFGSTAPVVGTAADGSIVVAWTAPGNHVNTTIHVRLFDAAGRPRSSAFRVSGGLESMLPELAVAPDGSFVVGWTGLTDGRNPDAFARRFAPDGSPVGERFLLHDDTHRDQILGGLALAPDGRLAAVFDSWEGEGLFFEVLLSLFAPDGTPELLDARVNVLPELAWASQYEATVVRLADGRWLVVFAGPAEHGETLVQHSVFGRLFTPEGSPLGPETVLPQVLSGEQRRPAAAPLADGGFVVLWTEDCPLFGDVDCSLPESYRDGSFAGVYGRAFDATGEAAGDDFRVSGLAEGSQMRPAIAAGPAGDVVATWTHQPIDGEIFHRSVWTRRLAAPCEAGASTLCLGDGRFRAEVEWHDFFGNQGDGVAEARDDLWGTFWFFDPDNLELAVKLIDGRAVNGRWWIFSASLSNVEYTLRLTDTANGRVATYHNPSGTFASRGDTAAFGDVEAATPEDPVETGGATAAAGAPAGRSVRGPPTFPHRSAATGGGRYATVGTGIADAGRTPPPRTPRATSPAAATPRPSRRPPGRRPAADAPGPSRAGARHLRPGRPTAPAVPRRRVVRLRREPGTIDGERSGDEQPAEGPDGFGRAHRGAGRHRRARRRHLRRRGRPRRRGAERAGAVRRRLRELPRHRRARRASRHGRLRRAAAGLHRLQLRHPRAGRGLVRRRP
jgi:hypothetical protein